MNLYGYWDINACPASFICTSPIPGTFAAITKELADGTTTSSVPVMTKVGLDIFERSSQCHSSSLPSSFVQIWTAAAQYYEEYYGTNLWIVGILEWDGFKIIGM